MILPIVAYDIFEYFLINGSSTDVDCNVFSVVLLLEQFSNGTNIVPV